MWSQSSCFPSNCTHSHIEPFSQFQATHQWQLLSFGSSSPSSAACLLPRFFFLSKLKKNSFQKKDSHSECTNPETAKNNLSILPPLSHSLFSPAVVTVTWPNKVALETDRVGRPREREEGGVCRRLSSSFNFLSSLLLLSKFLLTFHTNCSLFLSLLLPHRARGQFRALACVLSALMQRWRRKHGEIQKELQRRKKNLNGWSFLLKECSSQRWSESKQTFFAATHAWTSVTTNTATTWLEGGKSIQL